jgi:predicted MFS family arabinose efflux permease
VVIALPGGLLGRRFGDRRICAAGLALMILGGLLVGAGGGYGAALAGRLISGVGAVLFNLVLAKMATDWFAGREIVTAMGVILASWPFGIAVALVSQGALAAAAGWPAVMFATAALCAVALALVAGLYRTPPGADPAAGAPAPGEAAPSRFPPAREALPCVAAGVIWGGFNVGLVLFFSFGPPLLVERGHELVEAGALASLGLWVSMASLPLGGYLAERAGRPDAAIVVFSLAAGLALALLPVAPLPGLLCALFGLFIGPPAGAIMALPARALSLPNRAVGFGVFYTCYYAAMAVGPSIAGYFRDAWGTAAAALLFGSGLFVAVVPLLWLFHRLRTSTAGRRAAGPA